MLEQDWFDGRMAPQDADQLSSAVASKPDNAGTVLHRLIIHASE
jgi:hypothetical protein